MKDFMKTNCYDIEETMIIVGSCLERMEPEAFKALKNISENIYEVCLESTHLNMVITKMAGMLCRVNVRKLIFASVDKSPHCVQLHYIDYEIRKIMELQNMEIVHYVAVDNKLIEITGDTITKSRSLSDLQRERIQHKTESSRSRFE